MDHLMSHADVSDVSVLDPAIAAATESHYAPAGTVTASGEPRSHQSHYYPQGGTSAPSPYQSDLTGLASTAASANALSGTGQSQPPPPQQDVDDMLRKKRKAREHKACYPCRQRKVKCDLSRPCQTCRDRDHPELCSYHPPSKRQQSMNGGVAVPHAEDSLPTPASGGASGGSVHVSSAPIGRTEFEVMCRKLEGVERLLSDIRREIQRSGSAFAPSHSSNGQDQSPTQQPESGIDPRIGSQSHRPTHFDRHGLHTRNDAGDIVHLGGSSIPAMLYALGDGNTEGSYVQEMLGKTALPLFALDNKSNTYPFVDLWGLPHGSNVRAHALAESLPDHDQTIRLVNYYLDLGHVIFPGIADPDGFQIEVRDFLSRREHDADDANETQIYGRGYSWLGLLFAVLASGTQCSGMSRKERELTSQVYVCCSFECLRFTNFMSQGNLETVQTMAVIGHVLTNNMNAGTAWAFHGLTIRVAQALGLHQSCPPIHSAETISPRSRIWWAIVWLDSLLSTGYDRPSSVLYGDAGMPMPQHFGPMNPFHAAMYQLSKIALDMLRERVLQQSTQQRIDSTIAHRDAIAGIMRGTSEYLRDSRRCSSERETIEHWALYLHTSYNLSELFRQAISPNSDPELVRVFRRPCIEHLVNTVEAYLGLNNVTPFAKSSWAALQRGVSSALLLGILGEHTRSARARHLVARFKAVLQDLTVNVEPSEVSGPVRRSLAVLASLDFADPPPGSGSGSQEGSGDYDGGADDSASAAFIRSLLSPPGSSDGGSSAATATDGSSPHSMLNTILWGQAGASGGPAIPLHGP